MTAVILSQDVEPSSPAALAGLQPYTDYVVGSDQILQEVGCTFLPAGSGCLCACQVFIVLYKSHQTHGGCIEGFGRVDVYDRSFIVKVNIIFLLIDNKKNLPFKIKLHWWFFYLWVFNISHWVNNYVKCWLAHMGLLTTPFYLLFFPSQRISFPWLNPTRGSLWSWWFITLRQIPSER